MGANVSAGQTPIADIRVSLIANQALPLGRITSNIYLISATAENNVEISFDGGGYWTPLRMGILVSELSNANNTWIRDTSGAPNVVLIGTGDAVIRDNRLINASGGSVGVDIKKLNGVSLTTFVPVRELTAGALTDRSGTTAAGVAEDVAPANAARRYFLFQNTSAGDLWIDFGVDAVAATPAIKIASGGGFVMEGTMVSNQRISVIGAGIQTYSAKEG